MEKPIYIVKYIEDQIDKIVEKEYTREISYLQARASETFLKNLGFKTRIEEVINER